ncbi:unnamed protein product [Caenorhabditis nigoni]
MVNTRKGQKKPEHDEMLEKLKSVAAETGEIKSSQKRKFDEIQVKLQAMEESIAKIPKFNGDEEKSMMKFKEQIDSLEKSIVLNDRRNEKVVPRKSFVLKHVFGNLEKDEYDCSEYEEHFNLNWFMQIKRNESYLEFYIFSEPTSSTRDNFKIESKLEFRMTGKNSNSVIKTGEGFFKADYLIDGNLTVEVKVDILKMTGFGKENLMKFDESVADFSDIVLIVNDWKFYLSKYFLSLQSSYFKTIFSGKFHESEKNEIELKDIDPNDFQNFLELIHGESSIDDDTVSGIIHLAEMYDAPTAIRRCEEFLLEKSKKSLKNKLQMATRYQMINLKEKCMNEIKTVEDIRSVIPNTIDDLDHQTTLDLLTKSTSFH